MSFDKQQSGILLSVTLTGMAVLIIEIVALRILAPYFGNSVFTFSSVISTILAALAFGYYLGGRLADRFPNNSLFFSLIAASGLSVLLLQLLASVLLPKIAYTLSMISGPLIVSALLFILPALILGCLAPFAIKLLHTEQEQNIVGTIAGKVFFCSTFGSIIGSLATGFVLIPYFGIKQIIISVGLGLILLGGLGLLLHSKHKIKPLLGLIIVAASLIYATEKNTEQNLSSIVFQSDGLYEKIIIRDVIIDNQASRVLFQDLNSNSAMLIDTGEMAFEYTKYYDLYRLFTPKLKHVLAIGGGAYSVPKSILYNTPNAIVDVAEIEPTLHSIAQEYFSLPESPRLENHLLDGRRFLYESSKQYDLIFSDVFHTFAAVPLQFTTQEFFKLALSKLSIDGVFIANYFGSLEEKNKPFILSVLKTMRSVFPQVYLLATEAPNSVALQNFIFIGHNLKDGGKRVALSNAKKTTFIYALLNDIEKLEVNVSDNMLQEHPILTDNFAPVEYYAAHTIRQHTRN